MSFPAIILKPHLKHRLSTGCNTRVRKKLAFLLLRPLFFACILPHCSHYSWDRGGKVHSLAGLVRLIPSCRALREVVKRARYPSVLSPSSKKMKLVSLFSCHAQNMVLTIPPREKRKLLKRKWLISSVGRAADWKSACPWFESEMSHRSFSLRRTQVRLFYYRHL